ncbi:Ribosome biogenesis protein nsa1 (NOP7-associated protein 1) [Dipsacomyces acuminosporus]|nr:Ribosome biogenesis protein nsa1 (NOP7-associated protein 1) [Dipsacomyces acuminosporus]
MPSVEIDPKVSLLEAKAQAAKKARADAKAKALAKKGEKVVIDENVLAGVRVWNINGQVKREKAIDQMCQSAWASGESVFTVGRRNGDVEVISRDGGRSLYQFSDPNFLNPIKMICDKKPVSSRRYVGIGATDSHFITCTNMGEVRYQSFSQDLSGSDITADTLLMKLPENAFRMRIHPKRPSIFAVGGFEQELSIWDAETTQVASSEAKTGFTKATSAPIFRSKNVPNDFLNLRVPVWITDIQFTSDNTSNPTLAVSTHYSQIRLYDTKAKQRPVQDWEIGNQSISCILASHMKPELFFADNTGVVQKLDLRTGKVIGGYKGISGAVRSMALSEDGTELATAGADRFLRVHEADGMRRMLHRAYIKQRVSHIVHDWEFKDVDEEEAERQETEAIWDNMSTMDKPAKSKKRKTSAN